jgi:hypothetical protein
VSEWPNDRGLVLVFEQGGFVYAYRSLDEAAESIESIDVVDGHYLGAFSDRGEVIAMGEGDLFASFTPTGQFDHETLSALIKQSREPQHLADDPPAFALAVLEFDG